MDEERIAGWVARINRTELATLNATVQGVQRVIGDRRSSPRCCCATRRCRLAC